MYIYVYACVCMYIYVCVHIYIEEIIWCFLCLFLIFVVSFTQRSFSYNCAYDFFKLHIFICKVMAFLYGVFHCRPHSVLTCDASILFPNQTPALCIGSRSTALSASMHKLLSVTIWQMLLYLSPITYSPPPKMLTFHFSPSIVTRLESFHCENQRLCSMSVMASWFFGIAPSFVGKPGIWQHPLSFRNLKGDQHIRSVSLKRKKKACSSAFQPLTCSNYSIADIDWILYFRKIHMPCTKHGMSNCSFEIVS